MLCIGTYMELFFGFILIVVGDVLALLLTSLYEYVCMYTYISLRFVSHYACIIIFRLQNVRIRIEYNPIFEIIRLILRSLCNTLKSLCAKIGINCVENHHSNELKLEQQQKVPTEISIVDMRTQCVFTVYLCVNSVYM